MNLSEILTRFRRFVANHKIPSIVAGVGAVVVVVGLVVVLTSGGSSETVVPTTTTSTTEPAPTTRAATVIGPSITVLEAPPTGVSSPPTTVKEVRATMPAIPRNGLNSVGVKKVATGYEYTNPTYFQNPLVFMVLEEQGEWLRVLIPARPNHTEGWIRASEVTVTPIDYKVVLNLANFTLTVLKGNDAVIQTNVVIGRDNTYTPVGTFYITEKIQQSNPNGFYGPWVLATNGYSESLNLFDNGLPVIALHGTSQPGLIGTKASNGCIRIENSVITQMAEMLPAGTPFEVIDGIPVPN